MKQIGQNGVEINERFENLVREIQPDVNGEKKNCYWNHSKRWLNAHKTAYICNQIWQKKNQNNNNKDRVTSIQTITTTTTTTNSYILLKLFNFVRIKRCFNLDYCPTDKKNNKNETGIKTKLLTKLSKKDFKVKRKGQIKTWFQERKNI